MEAAANLTLVQCIGQLFIPLSTTVAAPGVISIRGASASAISPNTPAEAASDGYWEQAEVTANHAAQLYNTYLVFWCFVPFFCCAAGSCFPGLDEGRH